MAILIILFNENVIDTRNFNNNHILYLKTKNFMPMKFNIADPPVATKKASSIEYSKVEKFFRIILLMQTFANKVTEYKMMNL
jgi:hypothetical protein